MTTEQWINKMGEHNTDKYEAKPKPFQVGLKKAWSPEDIQRLEKYQAFYKACWVKIEALLEKHKDEDNSNS